MMSRIPDSQGNAHRRNRLRRWAVLGAVASVILGALPVVAVSPAASAASEPGRWIGIVAASPTWAVILNTEMDAYGHPLEGGEILIADKEGVVKRLAGYPLPSNRLVSGWSLAKDMLTARVLRPGEEEWIFEVAVWNLRTGWHHPGLRYAASYNTDLSAAPDGFLLRKKRTGALWHADAIRGDRTKFARPFVSPPQFYGASAGPKGVLVTSTDGRFRYLTWADPKRVRKIKQRRDDSAYGYQCPTVTAHAAYCIAEVGKKTTHVASETVFFDGRTAAVNIRTFVRRHGLELQLPVDTREPQLATSTSQLVSMANDHGRIVSIPFGKGKGKVRRSDGKIAGVRQVIRGLGAVLILGESGLYRLNKPTGKPHLVIPLHSL
jgi:hypothetical protein